MYARNLRPRMVDVNIAEDHPNNDWLVMARELRMVLRHELPLGEAMGVFVNRCKFIDQKVVLHS